MHLNDLGPAKGSTFTPKRRGRGIGSGLGKTGGRGHKGQRARAGGYHKVGFEGGQMPLQRRLPKSGFSSKIGRVTTQVTLTQLAKVAGDVADLAALKKGNLIPRRMQRAKVIASGKLGRALTVRGLGVTRGARSAIEAAGGRVEE